MPTQVTYLLEESHKSYDILVYFNRPQILSQLKYTELFKYYTCKKDIIRRGTLSDEESVKKSNDFPDFPGYEPGNDFPDFPG